MDEPIYAEIEKYDVIEEEGTQTIEDPYLFLVKNGLQSIER